jgi:hypothetical protein
MGWKSIFLNPSRLINGINNHCNTPLANLAIFLCVPKKKEAQANKHKRCISHARYFMEGKKFAGISKR